MIPTAYSSSIHRSRIINRSMRINVECDADTAARYHRSAREYIDAEPSDTIADVKIKLTLVYLGLNTDEFSLMLAKGRRLRD